MIQNLVMNPAQVSMLLSYQVESEENKPLQVHLTGQDDSRKLAVNEYSFYQISQLSYDEDYPHREAFENVLLTLDNTGFNFVYILDGDENGIELYIGVVRNNNENNQKGMYASNYGEAISTAFSGNFGGSVISQLKGDAIEKKIFHKNRNNEADIFNSAGVIVGIPSENNNDTDSAKGFQGIDRLINSMIGTKWRLVVVAEPMTKKEIINLQQEIYNIYNSISPWTKNQIQQSANKNFSDTENTGTNDNKSFSYTKQHSEQHGDSHSSNSDSRTNSYTSGESNGESTSRSTSHSKSKTTGGGQSQSVTSEFINKNAQEALKYIDEQLLERLKQGFSRGMYNTSIYYMAESPAVADRLKVGILSLFQGESSTYSPLIAHKIDIKNNDDILNTFQNIYCYEDNTYPERMMMLSRPHDNQRNFLSTYLTASEVCLVAGLPQKEIPGIILTEGIDFGLNVPSGGNIVLGKLIQKGRILENMPFKMSKEYLQKHTFIAGVTGSGKTTTCHKLLKEANVPFLVIEPAKTEYRTLIKSKHFKDCIVFTVGDENIAPFRFNPFELVEGENLSSHIDMLKATFTTAFPMEGSMPQLLEEAIYKCYEDKGWDIDTGISRNVSADSPFPILSDFLSTLTDVVKEKNFDKRLKDDYIGTLVSRFSNLRKGSKGRMLNTAKSVDFMNLLERNVIIELENLKSAEDKALIMGFVLTRLFAAIRKKHKIDTKFRHITLVEEAHRLLSKVEYGDSGLKKGSVEIFTDLLAEVRKYGEGLIVVDQIPNKLASETIKNTNTKIIHKILARDDKDTVGDTMLMDSKQKEFLSALNTGEAIVFTEGLKKPVHISIESISDTNEDEIEDTIVKERFEKYHQKNQEIYCEGDICKLFGYDFYMLISKTLANDGNDERRKNYPTEQISEFNKKIDAFVQSEETDKLKLSKERVLDYLVMEVKKDKLLSVSHYEALKRYVFSIFCEGIPIDNDYIKPLRDVIKERT